MLASRCAPLVALVVLGDCSTSPDSPTAPQPTGGPSQPTTFVPAVNPPPPPFPDLTQAGEIYLDDSTLYDFSRFGGAWQASRFVLYPENKFALQFSSTKWGFFEYFGHYTRGSSFIDLTFDADSRWWASGTFRGDTLVVKYSLIAGLSDFVDGRYVRARQ
jgi:hypothetical protein